MSQLGALHNRYLFLTFLEAPESKRKVLIDSVSGKSLLPDLQTATFSSFVKASAPSQMLYPHGPLTSQWPHLQTPSYWGHSVNRWIWRRHKRSVHGKQDIGCTRALHLLSVSKFSSLSSFPTLTHPWGQWIWQYFRTLYRNFFKNIQQW